MVDTVGGRISIWDGMNEKLGWNTDKCRLFLLM
jgi:hypothetical protein